MSRMTKLAQEDSTFSEFATTPRFRGFHSVNRGQLLASSAMDLGDQTGLNRGHPLKQKIHPTPLTCHKFSSQAPRAGDFWTWSSLTQWGVIKKVLDPVLRTG